MTGICGRGFWRDGYPVVRRRDLLVNEIAEAFAPVHEWRRCAPAERTPELYATVQDTLITLACWGWAIEVTRGRGRWTLTASRALGTSRIRAKVTGVALIDGLSRLGRKLESELEKSGSDELAIDREAAA